MLKALIIGRNAPPQSLQDFKYAIRQERHEVIKEIVQILALGMARRIQEVS